MGNSLISDEDRRMAIEFLLSVVRNEDVKTSHRIKAAKVLLKFESVTATQSAKFN